MSNPASPALGSSAVSQAPSRPRPRLAHPRRMMAEFIALVLVLVVLGAAGFSNLLAPTTAGGWAKDPDHPVIGGDLGTCFDLSVMHDGQTYRAWFSWRPKQSIAYTESTDGVNWSSSVIALGPTGSGWEDEVNRPSVVRTAAGFAMWYTWQTSTASAIGYATSPDGLHWTRSGTLPVLTASAAWEKQAVMSPDVRYEQGRYRMWYSGGEQYEPDAIGYATSPDGVHWTKDQLNPIFAGSGTGHWDGAKVTAPDVEPYGAGWAMFYIGFSDVDHAQIGIAYSPDGIHDWRRLPANPIIRPGNVFAWDSDAVYKPAVIHEPGRWILWYNGRRGSTEQIGRAAHEGDGLGL